MERKCRLSPGAPTLPHPVVEASARDNYVIRVRKICMLYFRFFLRFSSGLALNQSIALLRLEMGTAASGVGVMTDRLCEIILIQIFRTFGAGHSKGFLAALNDPPVRAVLNIIHSQYQDHWTIETLAQKVYISRSVLARRFNDLLGIPPIAYLTTWRMHKGMDLLMERQDMTIDNIAFAVGYSSAEAFERAFKRYFGRSPGMARKRGWTPDTAQDAARRGQDSKPAL